MFRSDVELSSAIPTVSVCKQFAEIGQPNLLFVGLRELKFPSDVRLSPPFFKFEQNELNVLSVIGRIV